MAGKKRGEFVGALGVCRFKFDAGDGVGGENFGLFRRADDQRFSGEKVGAPLQGMAQGEHALRVSRLKRQMRLAVVTMLTLTDMNPSLWRTLPVRSYSIRMQGVSLNCARLVPTARLPRRRCG